MRFAAILLLALGHFLPAQGAPVEGAEEKERKILTAYANALKTAVMVKDHEGLISFQYPELVEEAGGKEKVIEHLKAEEAKDKEGGWKTEWLELAPTNTIYAGSEFKVTFVPSITLLRGKTTKLQTTSFQIAFAKLNSDRWYFLDGTRLTTAQFRRFFKGLPEDLELPLIKIAGGQMITRLQFEDITVDFDRRVILPGFPKMSVVLPQGFQVNSTMIHEDIYQMRHPKGMGVLWIQVDDSASQYLNQSDGLIRKKFGNVEVEFRKKTTPEGSYAEAVIPDFFKGQVIKVLIDAKKERFYEVVWPILESVEKEKEGSYNWGFLFK